MDRCAIECFKPSPVTLAECTTSVRTTRVVETARSTNLQAGIFPYMYHSTRMNSIDCDIQIFAPMCND